MVCFVKSWDNWTVFFSEDEYEQAVTVNSEHMCLCFWIILFHTWRKMNLIFLTFGSNRMEPLLIPPELQWMSCAKLFWDTWYPEMVTFRGHPAPPISAPATSSYGGIWSQKVYLGKPRTIDELKEAIRREILTIPISMLEDVMENFQNRLQECINEEWSHLTDIVFHNYLVVFHIKIKFQLSDYKLIFISFHYDQN